MFGSAGGIFQRGHEFLSRHSEDYGGLSRGQLYKVDRGLYRALAASGDIEKELGKPEFMVEPMAFYPGESGENGG
jgi:hypothetical protein